MNPYSTKSDFVADLWQTLSPYLGISQSIIAIGYLLAGGGHNAWPNVMALFGLQIAVDIFLTLQSRKIKNVFILSNIFAFFNWFVCAAIVIITGGYPSLFWLLFVLGAIQSGLFIGRLGVLMNMLFAGVAMSAPRLVQMNLSVETAIEISLLMVLLLALGLITEKSTTLLLDERAKYKQAEEALRHSHDSLASSLEEQERQAREMTLLTEMGDFLQACSSLEETFSIIRHYMQKLFAFPHGRLFLYNASRDTMEGVTGWGRLDADGDPQLCSPGHCWALRRGQVFWVDDASSGLRCRHLLADTAMSQYVCVPMMAQGETLGVMHLHGTVNDDARLAAPGRDPAKTISLAKTVGEHIALAIANLNLRESLRNQSIRDPLTGLFNRRYLEETLDREIHRAVREKRSLSIIFMDIDHFKGFNDTYGHETGDAILRELGAFLNAQVRYADIACRYGGEEFVIVLPDAPLEIARQRAEDMRAGVKLLDVKGGEQTLQSITLSLGVSAIPEFEAKSESLLRAADAALYQAKAEGRDRVVVAKAVA